MAAFSDKEAVVEHVDVANTLANDFDPDDSDSDSDSNVHTLAHDDSDARTLDAEDVAVVDLNMTRFVQDVDYREVCAEYFYFVGFVMSEWRSMLEGRSNICSSSLTLTGDFPYATQLHQLVQQTFPQMEVVLVREDKDTTIKVVYPRSSRV